MSIEFSGITKIYGDVTANDDISFIIESGTIHALLGENGAGKTTLIKILTGQLEADSGKIIINGDEIKNNAFLTKRNRVGVLGQDPLDFKNFTVRESFFAGLGKDKYWINNKNTDASIINHASNYGFVINPETKISDLSIGKRQELEFLRLLYNETEIIVLDEPTSGLTDDQKVSINLATKEAVKNGATVIIVSHKLMDVIENCDRATILKSGKFAGTFDMPCDPNLLTKAMFQNLSGGPQVKSKLHLNNENVRIDIPDYFFTKNTHKNYNEPINLQKGSIVAIAGLQGSGTEEFIRSCFEESNNYPKFKLIQKKTREIQKFQKAYVPSDRIEKGLFKDVTILEHFAILYYKNKPFINWKSLSKKAEKHLTKLRVKGNVNNYPTDLSGGNQQRLMLSMLPNQSSLLLLEDPTRGLDIQSALDLWNIIMERVQTDILVVFNSSDTDEIEKYADYIVCFYDGKIRCHHPQSSNDGKNFINHISGLIESK